MAKNSNVDIRLSGNMLTDKDDDAQAGDVYIYRRDDQNGRFARAGGHTNLGYSGYFLASVFDGARWRKLQINESIEYDYRSFRFVSEVPEVQRKLANIIAKWEGNLTTYRSEKRSFSIIDVSSTLVASPP